MAKLVRDPEEGYAKDTLKVLPVLRDTFKALGFTDTLRVHRERKNVASFRDNEISVVTNLEYDRVYPQHNDDNPIASNAYCVFPEHNSGTGLAFIREGFIERVVVSSLHEFGHLLGNPLDNNANEEAKAYAFVSAGAKLIKDRDIGGLRNKIMPIVDRKPSAKHSPEHYSAYEFVANLVKKGMDPLDLYEMLCNRSLSVNDSF